MLGLLTRQNLHRLHVLYVVGFLFAFSQGLVLFFLSEYIGNFFGNENVGYLFTFSFIIAIFALNILPMMLTKNGLLLSFIGFVCLYILSLFGQGWSQNLFVIGLAFVLFMVARVSLTTIMTLWVERNSTDALTGRIRGALLAFINLGWLLPVIIGGFLIDLFGFQTVFGLSMIVILITLIPLFTAFKIHEKFILKQHTYSFKKAFAHFRKNSNLRNIFLSKFFTISYFTLTVIYIPLYLHDVVGYSWSLIGIIVTFSLLPHVIMTYPLGRIADLWLGEKEILTAGYSIIAIALLIIGLLTTTNPFIWAGVLFLLKVGGSAVEDMNDSYFYKQVDGNDSDLITFFMNPWPLGYIIMPTVWSIILYFYPMNILFLITGVLFFGTLIPILSLEDTK